MEKLQDEINLNLIKNCLQKLLYSSEISRLVDEMKFITETDLDAAKFAFMESLRDQLKAG